MRLEIRTFWPRFPTCSLRSHQARQAARLGAAAAGIALFLPALAIADSSIGPARQAQLIHLLKHDCGSCHGMTLKGGLGPALLPEIMAKRPAAVLRQIILDGIPDSPMPPWRGQLTEAEVDWLVTALQQGVHDE